MIRDRLLHIALAAGFLVAVWIFVPVAGHAQTDPKISKPMTELQAATEKLGAPKLQGMEAVSDKTLRPRISVKRK